MTPANPDNNKPFIYRIADALGITHLVVAVQHSHLMSEITGLLDALAAKAAKVSGATNNNLAALDANGDLKDSGHGVTGSVSYGSSSLITSGGVHAALQGKADKNKISETSQNGAYAMVEAETTDKGQLTIGLKDDGDSSTDYTSLTKANIGNLKRALLDPDTTPTADSDNLVTSGGVKAVLDGKQDALTFDSTPTAGSTNPVTSGGVKAALDGKQNTLTFDTTPTANSTNPVTSGGVKAALDGKAPEGDTEVIFEEGENLFVYLPNYFSNGERQRSFILNYQGEQKELIELFGCSTHDMIRILSQDDSLITVGECYIAVRVIKQPSGVEQGDVYYIIFDGRNDY